MMRILYVEDNPANLFLVKRVAKVGGHEVINYVDGEQALSNINQDKPDMILMDIQLAGAMSGLDVVQKLRSDGCHLPIIAVTAYAMLGDRERFLAAGCDDYLAKPLPIPRLVEMLDHYNQQVDSKPKPKTHPLLQRPLTGVEPTPSAETSAPAAAAPSTPSSSTDSASTNGAKSEGMLSALQPPAAPSTSPNGTHTSTTDTSSDGDTKASTDSDEAK